MKKIALAVALALGTVVQPVALAGTVTGIMAVNVTVTGTCSSVAASPLSFGSVTNDQENFSVLGQTTIAVNCSNGTLYAVDLNNGLDPSPAGVRFLSGTGGYFGYDLYQDAARTIPWGSGQPGGSAFSSVMGVSGTANHTVYGTIQSVGTGMPPGTYTDMVTVTVTY